MRILHIDPDDIDNPLSGGGPVRTFEICRRLAERHEVTVLTPTFPGSTPRKQRDAVRYHRIGRRVGDHGSSHHLTFFFLAPFVAGNYPHDILVEDFMPPAAATFLPLLRRGPLVASVQWFMAQDLSRQFHLPFWLGEQYGIRLYRNFVVLTEEMRRLITDRHRKARCEVIPNAVDPALFQIPPNAGQGILYLGRIDFQQKGVDLLLQALALMPPAKRPKLTLAGHSFIEDELRARIESLGLEGHVRYVGRVDAGGRATLLADARVVCVPSRSETFGMVILEASAAAKTVVTFDRWPMNEVAAPDSAIRVAFLSVPELSGALAAADRLDDSELLRRGLRARSHALNYDWNTAAERQEAFYERVVHEHANP